MQGLHVFNPQARTVINLESFIPDDHFLRKVDRVLDLSFVRELTASCYVAGQGWPSIDPEVYFRMVLVGFLYWIVKDRRLISAFLWILKKPPKNRTGARPKAGQRRGRPRSLCRGGRKRACVCRNLHAFVGNRA